MRYNKVNNAENILKHSKYLINNPEKYRNNWHSIFNNSNKISIELGMGRGLFIMKMAEKYPNINFIGIENDINQCAFALKRIESKNINNLKIICMDASKIDEIFAKEIDTIYLTFSEPWPKKGDEKRRFTSNNYLRIYDKIFKKDKHIILKTDNKILFQSALESLSDYWYTFEKVSLDLHNDERNIDNILTDFEEEYKKEGRSIYYLDAYYKN